MSDIEDRMAARYLDNAVRAENREQRQRVPTQEPVMSDERAPDTAIQEFLRECETGDFHRCPWASGLAAACRELLGKREAEREAGKSFEAWKAQKEKTERPGWGPSPHESWLAASAAKDAEVCKSLRTGTKIEEPVMRDCLVCGGTGRVANADEAACDPKYVDCTVCNGSGKVPAPDGKTAASEDTPLPSPRVSHTKWRREH